MDPGYIRTLLPPGAVTMEEDEETCEDLYSKDVDELPTSIEVYLPEHLDSAHTTRLSLCKQCKVYRIPGAKHCNFCKACCEDLDHVRHVKYILYDSTSFYSL